MFNLQFLAQNKISSISIKNFSLTLLLFFSLMFTSLVHAQEENDKKEGGFEYGFLLGKLLPNSIDDATEIVPQWGIRASHPWHRYNLEYGFLGGAGEGVSWGNLHVSLRIDLPVEQILGNVYLGFDAISFKPDGKTQQLLGAGHVGGGIMSQIDPDIWFRLDMKLNVNPGTSMFFGVGFMIR